MSAQFTPGPWAWFGNRSGVYLATPDRGRRYIMGFRRYGMNGAQPTFNIGSIMRPAAELVSFAVGDRSVRGFKQADGDTSVYRYDIDGIDHPDARLIAAAPELFDALQAVIEMLASRQDIVRAIQPLMGPDEHGTMKLAADALAKATGK